LKAEIQHLHKLQVTSEIGQIWIHSGRASRLALFICLTMRNKIKLSIIIKFVILCQVCNSCCTGLIDPPQSWTRVHFASNLTNSLTQSNSIIDEWCVLAHHI